MRKILFIAGSRGEYGYIRPIIQEIKKRSDIDYDVLATNMHLLPKFGKSIDEFAKDGIKVSSEIYNTLDGYNHLTMPKSLGILLLQLPETLSRIAPDIVLISGDRGEQLMAAIAAIHMNIPVAHVQAGELSGNVDGVVRHAITKLSHIHFASNEDAKNRVLSLGEQEFRVFQTGAPLIDELLDDTFPTPKIREKYGISTEAPLFLIVNHPVTEEQNQAADQMNKLLSVMRDFNGEKVIICPNSDAGSLATRRALHQQRDESIHMFFNLPRNDYVGFLKDCDIMVGNSSSGIMEAPTFSKPVVNIGRRQKNRVAAQNVIHVEDYRENMIKRAIKLGLSEEFKQKIAGTINPYGTSSASERITDILSEIPINDMLLNKKMTY